MAKVRMNRRKHLRAIENERAREAHMKRKAAKKRKQRQARFENVATGNVSITVR